MVGGHGRTWPVVVGKPCRQHCWCHCQGGPSHDYPANSTARSGGIHHSRWTSSSRWVWSPTQAFRLHRYAARLGMVLEQAIHISTSTRNTRNVEIGETSPQGCSKNVNASTRSNCLPQTAYTRNIPWYMRESLDCPPIQDLSRRANIYMSCEGNTIRSNLDASR